MKLSLNWIKDYVEIPADMDLSALAHDLTMSTVEVEGAENLAERFEKIIVGEIKEVNPHPNANKLRVCKVDIGDGEIKDIVCGGSNLEIDQKVVVACPGAMVRWHGEGDLVEIKNAELRGVPSFGMICASEEVGLADLLPSKSDHEIMDVTAFGAKAGTPISTALGLDDVILEIDNKSMTNRPDLWGHYGIAREIAALYDLPLKTIDKFVPQTTQSFPIIIEDEDRCPRYIGAKIEGLGVKPAPFEMQSRIWRVGMRPINALVDVTNYVMLAVGQPTHVFDSNHIIDRVEVRLAKENETLRLLNDKEIVLSTDDLVIADKEGAVALAGVMGGAKDSVLPETDSVILEVANFNSQSVRRTALRYDNRTEASARYEKAIDPERCDQALALAVRLFKEIFPEMKITAFSDNYVKPLERKKIDVEIGWLTKRLGKEFPKELVAKKLGIIGFGVDFDGEIMHVTVPTWRSTGDVSIKEDVMEEVARLYGYENFEPTPISITYDGGVNQLDYDLVRKVKEYLAFRADMQEIFTYPWMSDEFVNALFPSTDKMLALATPPSPTERLVRSSLLPNICKVIVKNEHNFEQFDIFEEAKVFIDDEYTSNYKNEKLPCEKRRLGMAFVGKFANISNIFRRAKGVIENMPRYTHMEGFTFKKVEKPCWADGVVWQNIYLGDKKIGDIALLGAKQAKNCGMKVLSAVLVEMDMEEFVPFKSRTNRFERLREFPLNEYDVSFIVDSLVTFDTVASTLMQVATQKPLLRAVKFVDEYKGEKIPQGKKSVTIRLEIGSDEKTLTGAEIDDVANAVMDKIESGLKGEVRRS